jgi:hypothetical protein
MCCYAVSHSAKTGIQTFNILNPDSRGVGNSVGTIAETTINITGKLALMH